MSLETIRSLNGQGDPARDNPDRPFTFGYRFDYHERPNGCQYWETTTDHYGCQITINYDPTAADGIGIYTVNWNGIPAAMFAETTDHEPGSFLNVSDPGYCLNVDPVGSATIETADVRTADNWIDTIYHALWLLAEIDPADDPITDPADLAYRLQSRWIDPFRQIRADIRQPETGSPDPLLALLANIAETGINVSAVDLGNGQIGIIMERQPDGNEPATADGNEPDNIAAGRIYLDTITAATNGSNGHGNE